MSKQMNQLIGWDIGGAHLKAVVLNDVGNIVHIKQVPCALWLGLDQLEAAIDAILNTFDIAPDLGKHFITMTGELVDLFANRHDGVAQISTLVVDVLGDDVLFYCMQNEDGDNFLSLEKTLEHTESVASANWHASASLLASSTLNALLIDIGSTTTDITAIENGKVVGNGFTDAARMQEDTLVYTGVVRTPVMAIAQKLVFDGKAVNVAAEYFATMADVYRLTGELLPAVDMADTADGQEKTIQASAKRLARMVGHDAEDKSIMSWQSLASDCREKQMEQIQSAVMKKMNNNMTIVGAGAGAFLAKAIAERLDKPYVRLETFFQPENHDLAICLPAYAVAKLALLKGAL